MTRVKFIVEKAGDGMKFGSTNTPLYVYGNINKCVGLWDIFQSELNKCPPSSGSQMVANMYHFIALIRFHTSNKKVHMVLFDTENKKEKALEYFLPFKEKGEKEISRMLIDSFKNLESTYEEVRGIAELVFPKK